MTNAEILVALAKRYAPPAFAFLQQVRSRTGYGGDIRTADALAMSLYPSRGLDLVGLEIKTSRKDVMRELKDPAKAEEICRYCDRWWLVVGDAAIVEPGELPPTWGLLVPRGAGLVAKVEAPALNAEPIGRAFLAAVLRNVGEQQADMIPRASVADEIHKALVEGVARGEERQRDSAERLRKRIADFEAASGVAIDEWSAGRVGEAVRFVLNNNVEIHRRQLESLRDRARRIADDIDARLAGKIET